MRNQEINAIKSRPYFRWTLPLVLILLVVSAVSAQAASRNNAATIYVQEKSNWCWVAISKTVIKRAGGNNASQCQIYKWGKNGTTCPNSAGQFGLDVSRAFIKSGVSSIGSVTGIMSFANVRNEIDLGRLLMARWAWTSGSVGHMIVIKGYDTTAQQIYYIDPLKSVAQVQSYAWAKSGGGHTWTHSRYNIF